MMNLGLLQRYNVLWKVTRFLPHLFSLGNEVYLPVLPAKLIVKATGKCQNHAVLKNHVLALESFAPGHDAIGSKSCKFKEDKRCST